MFLPLYSGEISACIHRIGVYVSLRAGLKVALKKCFTPPRIELRLVSCSACSLVTIVTELYQLFGTSRKEIRYLVSKFGSFFCKKRNFHIRKVHQILVCENIQRDDLGEI